MEGGGVGGGVQVVIMNSEKIKSFTEFFLLLYILPQITLPNGPFLTGTDAIISKVVITNTCNN